MNTISRRVSAFTFNRGLVGCLLFGALVGTSPLRAQFLVANQGADGGVSEVSASGALSYFAPGADFEDSPDAMAYGSNGDLYVGSYLDTTITQITRSGTVSVFTSNPALDDVAGLAFNAGNLYVAEYNTNVIAKITPGGVVSTFSSGGLLSGPQGMLFDSSGNLFVSNNNNNIITKIAPDGSQSLFATIPNSSMLGSITMDASGLMYATNWADSVYTIDAAGTVSLFASGIPSGQAAGIAVDSAGDVFVSDFSSTTIYKVTPDKTISLFASDPSPLDNPTLITLPADLLMVSTVPEPAEWCLIFGAVALAAAVWNRRRSRAVATVE